MVRGPIEIEKIFIIIIIIIIIIIRARDGDENWLKDRVFVTRCDRGVASKFAL